MPEVDQNLDQEAVRDRDGGNITSNSGNRHRRIRVMAVDDHDLILDGVRRRFADAPDTEFIEVPPSRYPVDWTWPERVPPMSCSWIFDWADLRTASSCADN